MCFCTRGSQSSGKKSSTTLSCCSSVKCFSKQSNQIRHSRFSLKSRFWVARIMENPGSRASLTSFRTNSNSFSTFSPGPSPLLEESGVGPGNEVANIGLKAEKMVLRRELRSVDSACVSDTI